MFVTLSRKNHRKIFNTFWCRYIFVQGKANRLHLDIKIKLSGPKTRNKSEDDKLIIVIVIITT